MSAAKESLKIVLFGDQGVGKTSIINRFVNKTFSDNSKVSLGVQKLHSVLKLEEEGKIVTLDFLDTAGQEGFQTLTPDFFKADVVLICYDVTDKKTFHATKDWLDEFNTHTKLDCRFQVFLVGTKNDLVSKRQVSVAEAEEEMKSLPIDKEKAGTGPVLHFETSAKMDVGVQPMFRAVVKATLARSGSKRKKAALSTTIKGSTSGGEGGGGCCVIS